MKRFAVFLIALLIGVFSVSIWLLYQRQNVMRKTDDMLVSPSRKVENRETPSERFYRKGGRSLKADVISQEGGELTTENILGSRDLSLYVQGGHFNCDFYVDKSGSQINRNEKRARNFVWNNWREKNRAYLRLTYSSDDATSTSHIFVEPDEEGKWQVIWRIVRDSNEIDDVPKVVSIEKVEDKPEKKQWALILRDKEGDIMQTLPHFYIENE